ncbi:MAG: dUTPase [Candidatus Ancaeobacter aquaticus]|nr:dUTPase [Candidatus Ancaeobacter aquaticus]
MDKDKLDLMFEMQKELNKRIGVDTDTMTDDQRQQWVLNYCRALSQETAELVDSVPWKWWAKYQDFDKQNARVEVVDLFHFLISLAQVLELSSEDICNTYIKKNKVNHDRQLTGYAVKDEADNKNI